MTDFNTPDSIPATPDGLVDRDALSSPASPGSADSSEASTPLEAPSDSGPDIPKRVPSLRTVSDPQNMNPSSTPLGMLSNARRPPPTASMMSMGSGAMHEVMAKARALQAQRMGKPAGQQPPNSMSSSPVSPVPRQASPGGALPGGLPANLKLPGGLSRPPPGGMPRSAPVIQTKPSLAARRGPMMKLSDMSGSSPASPTPKLSDVHGSSAGSEAATNGTSGSKMDDFKKYIDSEKGWITFDGAATITKNGVNFANGTTFTISLDEVEVMDELGKGNYGTVYKVRHTKPRVPRFGSGLSGFKHANLNSSHSDPSPIRKADGTTESSPVSATADSTSGRVMAMKEIRLELEEAKFTTILKELVILHECISPYIIDFYGAFFQEGAVYMCIEYMDGGSIDKLYHGGIPEGVLRKITYSTVMGLKSLKDEHNIIHRDVKPTNILANTRGQVKICDFGVSGNLVASIAKTNIGCQSYMAPERISGGGMAAGADGTYSVQSDIWSLGLTIIECAMGRYPYPPEVSSTIFSQLSAIVEGEPPGLPEEGYSSTAHDFVKKCLNKVPKDRPTYSMLLQHPWLAPFSKIETIAEEAEDEDAVDATAEAVGTMSLSSGTEDEEVAAWVNSVLERKRTGLASDAASRPALHAAPLDSVSPTASPLAGSGGRLE
ncbi:Protein kinase wis1 [Colletotrichum chlorophyti]|uniref:mitogen-activated protein kinase kinase n=1 Tax=Colletotrichum chlorophyti TaxID=708187 RepID=A0A1Q8S5F4_9PEZI|nr:Protein kinase wis1 [Colletotrichum chlorophyti]